MNKDYLDQRSFKDGNDKNEYYNGMSGAKYGIYNTYKKCFQFHICEDSPHLALARLYYMIGKGAGHPKFDPRKLSMSNKSFEQQLVSKLINLCSSKPIKNEGFSLGDYKFNKGACITAFENIFAEYPDSYDTAAITNELYLAFIASCETAPDPTEHHTALLLIDNLIYQSIEEYYNKKEASHV